MLRSYRHNADPLTLIRPIKSGPRWICARLRSLETIVLSLSAIYMPGGTIGKTRGHQEAKPIKGGESADLWVWCSTNVGRCVKSWVARMLCQCPGDEPRVC